MEEVINVHIFNLSYFLCRRKLIPSLPNQVSEGQAHCMMELAKRLLLEAGGSQNTVIFNASQGSQNNAQRSGIFFSYMLILSMFSLIMDYHKNLQDFAGPHRLLHICSFLIGLYALGLNNLLSASWQTRTYSTNVSWIHGQAIEIGRFNIKMRNSLNMKSYIIRSTFRLYCYQNCRTSLGNAFNTHGGCCIGRQGSRLNFLGFWLNSVLFFEFSRI